MKAEQLGGGLGDRRLETVVNTCEDAIATLDLDGTILTWNEAAAELCGYSVDEAVGATLWTLVVPRELMHERDELLDTVARGIEVRRRATRRRKDGSRMLLQLRMAPVRDDDGTVIGSVWVARDVTTERELQKAERRIGSQTRWRARIEQALESDRLVFAAQPLLDLRSGGVTRFELLMRMQIGERLVSPGQFLRHAERTGQVRALDRWAIRQGIHLARAHPVAINISGTSLSDVGLLGEVRDAAAAAEVDLSRLTIEITETAAARDLVGAARLIRELRELGCGVALDDFGTGFASLTYLHRLPVSELKIDREFIGSGRSANDWRVVETVLATARIFGMLTVAEGIEDESAAVDLRELGVDLGQGFLLGGPTPVRTAEELGRLLDATGNGRAARWIADAAASGASGPTDAAKSPRTPLGASGEDWLPQLRGLARRRVLEARALRSAAARARDQARARRLERESVFAELGRTGASKNSPACAPRK